MCQTSPVESSKPESATAISEAPALSSPVRILLSLWGILALVTICTFWQRPYPMVLISPFRFQLTGALLVFGLPLSVLVRRPKRWVFTALPLAIGMTFLPYLRTDGTVAPTQESLTMALANVYSGNSDLTRLKNWVEKEQPDVLGLLEVTEAHRSQIESLPYAYKLIHPRASNFGLALLSRTPPNKIVVLEEDTPFPSILATWPDYRVLLTHPIPPISPRARTVGDAQVKRLAATLAHESPSLVVIGDLNATGWDARMEPFLDSGLKEGRLGHGLLPTWPVGRPYMAIPLDHILLPPGWESKSCRTGPDIGSDHYPLLLKAGRSK